MRKKSTRRALMESALALLLCFSMLVGSTLAWFTDKVVSSGNIIKSGDLQIDMQWAAEYKGDETVWNDAAGEDAKPVFDYQNWEPGYSEVRYIKVSNEGDLAFKWLMNIIPVGEVGKLAEVIEVRYDVVTDNAHFAAPTAENKVGSLRTAGTLADVIAGSDVVVQGVLLPEGEEAEGYYSGEVIACITLHMQETAGNEYQDDKIGDSFNILLRATQYNYEYDDFGNDYDLDATYPPIVRDLELSQNVKDKIADGKLTEKVEFKDSASGITATLPAGTAVDSEVLTLKIQEDKVDKNITLDQRVGYDVEVLGVSFTNDTVILISMPGMLPANMNAVQLYHEGVVMQREFAIADIGADEFYYDKTTGDVVFGLTHFSNISAGATTSVYVNGKQYTGIEVKLNDYENQAKETYIEGNYNIVIPNDGNTYILTFDNGDGAKRNELKVSGTWHESYNLNPGDSTDTTKQYYTHGIIVEDGATVILNNANIRTNNETDAIRIGYENSELSAMNAAGIKYFRGNNTKTNILVADGSYNCLVGKSGVGFGYYTGADVYIEGNGCLYTAAIRNACPGIGTSEKTDGGATSYAPSGPKVSINVGWMVVIPMQGAAGIGGGFLMNSHWSGMSRIAINGGAMQVYSGADATAIGTGKLGNCGEIVINGGKLYLYCNPANTARNTMGIGAYGGSCAGIYVSKDADIYFGTAMSWEDSYADEKVYGFEPMSGLTVNGASMYAVGDTLKVDSVTVAYRDVAAQEKTSGYTVGSVDMTTGGRKTVTVSYKENGNTIFGTYSFTIKDSFNAIVATPKKNMYSTGYNLTVADFDISAIASDGTKGDISGCTISAVDMSTVGQKSVTITYTNPASGKTISTTCQINVVNTTISTHKQYWFDPFIFYLGDETVNYYKSYTSAANDPYQNLQAFPYLGDKYVGVNGETATGFFNHFGECQQTANSPSQWYVQMGYGQYGLNITEALPWTTVGVGYVTSYDATPVGVGYYIDGDVSTLKYNQPDYFKNHAGDDNYNAFLAQYGDTGFATNTKLKLSDFEAGSKHTITWVVVFEDGIQKISDWTITMKSSFGDNNYFKDTDKPNVNVVVLSGQSNAAGATVITQNDINKYSSVDYKNVYIQYKNVYFDGAGNLIENDANMTNGGFEKYTFGVSGFQSNTFGPEAALAYHLATDPELKGQQWFIIKYAAPGTSLNLHWQNNFDLSGKMMNYVESCVNTLSKDYDVQIRSFLWMQGENDAIKDEDEANKVSAESYAVNEQNLVSAFRLKFAKYATRPNGSVPGSGIGFITAGIAPASKDGLYLWEYSNIVNAAKVNNAQIWYVPGILTEYSALYGKVGTPGMHINPNGAIYNSAYIDTSLMSTQAHDPAHYDQQSMEWLGTWFGQYVAVLMNNEGTGGSSGSTAINKTTYAVTLNSNNGFADKVVIVAKDGYTVLGTPSAPANSTFLGWSDGTNTYAAGTKYTPTKNVTLTAQWTEIKYTITVVNNASNITVSGIKTGDTATADQTINFTIRNSGSAKTVTVKDSYGNTLYNNRLSRNGSSTLTLKMQAADVTVTIS